MLESRCHSDNAFVTLTYSEEFLPKHDPVPYGKTTTSIWMSTLDPSDLRNWLKRLRKAIEPSRLRFYAVGEYGDETERPHYHAILFGFPTCRQTQTQYTRDGLIKCCSQCELVAATWSKGRISLGTVETSSLQYVCGYVTKKMVRRDDPRLFGRHPEFSRQSLRPGIGAPYVGEIVKTIKQFNLDTTQSDAPVTLRHGKRQLPLGRYLTGKTREALGKEKNAPESVLLQQEERMRSLREAARASSENPSIKGQYLTANKTRITSKMKMRKIHSKDRKL